MHLKILENLNESGAAVVGTNLWACIVDALEGKDLPEDRKELIATAVFLMLCEEWEMQEDYPNAVRWNTVNRRPIDTAMTWDRTFNRRLWAEFSALIDR